MYSELRNLFEDPDGASRFSADYRLRRAGSGIFYGADDARNEALPLPGRVQTFVTALYHGFSPNGVRFLCPREL